VFSELKLENGCTQGSVFSELKPENGSTQGSLRAPMRATEKAILTDARNGLLGNGCAQGMEQITYSRNLHPGCTQPLESPGVEGVKEASKGEEGLLQVKAADDST